MATDQRPTSVLVVDDTVENLRLLAGILGDRGYDPRPVTNGADALSAAEQDPPDLILLDITMPVMDGFEVCRALKSRESLRDIPVIFLTALTSVEDKVAGFAAGGVDFITKPFQVDEVIARASTQVALSRARRDLADSLARLRALERVRDDLVQMIIHDMRGLLTVVIANLELAQPALDGQPAADVAAALGAAEAIARMANTVLDTSRLREGKMPVRRASADVAAIAADAARTFGALDATRTLRCVAEAPVVAACDADLIRRVIENLVGNALKHTPSGGTIVITVRADHQQLHVSIADDGPGVPEDVRTTLFDKFATSKKGSKYHSAGLGLAFCRLAIEAHGGSIGVEPAVPSGSNFWFSIPL